MDSPVFKTYGAKGIILAVLANIVILISLTQLIKAEAEKNEQLILTNVTIAKFRPKPPPPEREEEEEPEPEKKEPEKIIQPMEDQIFSENIDMDLDMPEFEVNSRIEGSGFAVPKMKGNPAFTDYNRLINFEKLDKIPVPRFKRNPIYPYRAKRMGIEGFVDVSFVVDEKGGVSDIKILKAVPKGIFEKNVIDAVSSWRYAPGELMGRNVKTLVKTQVKFQLEE